MAEIGYSLQQDGGILRGSGNDALEDGQRQPEMVVNNLHECYTFYAMRFEQEPEVVRPTLCQKSRP